MSEGTTFYDYSLYLVIIRQMPRQFQLLETTDLLSFLFYLFIYLFIYLIFMLPQFWMLLTPHHSLLSDRGRVVM